MTTRRLALLGSTGSIGTQTLEAVRTLNAREDSPVAYDVVALAAGRRLEELTAQIREFRPERVAIQEPQDQDALQARLQATPDLTPNAIDLGAGPDALDALVRESGADRVVNGIVGAAGLRPTLAALAAGLDLALANKESLVVGGSLVARALTRSDARLIPVDSEHSALFQLLAGHSRTEVDRLVLPASGGALRDRPLETLDAVTPEDVLAHPTWSMGARITVDSATLVNKAFEVIEAHGLFAWPYSRIEAVIQPQSLVHALVTLRDGGVRAALSPPDMAEPIRYALTYPDRAPIPTSSPTRSWADWSLEFRDLDPARYPAFETVVAAGRAGGTAPAVANAADEVLVERFLAGEIPFPRIASGLAEVLEAHEPAEPSTWEDVLAADRDARAQARRLEP